MTVPDPHWLDWAKRLHAIAQTGLTYATNEYDTERYTAIREIATEMMADGLGVEPRLIAGWFTGDTGYATPKVDVRAAVFHQDRILLVREREDGCWTLPGGWADIGDSPSAAAVRETKEESGYDVRAVKLAAVYDRNLHGHPPIPYHAWKVFFICELLGGSPATSNETDAAGFFAEDALPPLSLTRTTPAQIAHLFEHYRHGEWPASYD